MNTEIKTGTVRYLDDLTNFEICQIKNRFGASKFVENYARLAKIVEHHRGLDANCRILVVAGSWDLIHIGHARYNMHCRNNADVVIVLIDPDEAIHLSKGPDRPATPEDERAEMMAHLAWSDYVAYIQDFSPTTGLWEMQLPFRPTTIVASKREPANPAFYEQLTQHCDEVLVLPSQAQTSTSNKLRDMQLKVVKKVMQALETIGEEFGLKVSAK